MEIRQQETVIEARKVGSRIWKKVWREKIGSRTVDLDI